MSEAGSQKYGFGNLRLERGGQYAKRPARSMRMMTTGEWRLDEEMAAAFAAIESENGTVPSRGIQEIRERRQHPWRVLARRFIEARRSGADRDSVKAPLRVLELWIDDTLFNDATPNRAA